MRALLEVAGLCRYYGGLRAVDGLSFDVRPGEIVGLIGPNGAGKTTVVNLISGVVRVSKGRVTLDGTDVTALPPHRRAAQGLVRTFQSTSLYAARTVRENALRAAYLRSYRGFFPALLSTRHARAAEAQAWAETAELLDWLDLTHEADRVAGTLSYGMQKLLGIVMALAARPRLILLDEPVAGLSAEEADNVRDVILRVRDRGIGVVAIDHNMRFIAGLCDRVVVMHHGQELAAGRPQDVLANTSVIDAYLGTAHGAA
jgi:branched-chain amino acid transport system ATP-binding protein